MVKIKIQKIHEEAIIPKYAHKGDSGMDLFSTVDVKLPSMARVLIPTGIKIAMPIGYEAQVRPKSGLALKEGLSVVNTPGTVDAEYRGEVGVILINYSKNAAYIEKGQKVAQLVISKVEHASITEVDNLDKTSRGSGGFGSTGKK